MADATSFEDKPGKAKEFRTTRITDSSGHAFSLFEAEEVLRKHPAVRSVVAFAVPHYDHAEVVGVAVVAARESPTIAELRSFAAGMHLSPSLLPEVLTCVGQLPKAPGTEFIARDVGAANELGLLTRYRQRQSQHDNSRFPSSLLECEALILEAVGELASIRRTGGSEALKRQPFVDLGINSLTAVSLVRALNSRLDPLLALRATAVFDHPSVRQLGAFVLAELDERLAGGVGGRHAEPERATAVGSSSGDDGGTTMGARDATIASVIGRSAGGADDYPRAHAMSSAGGDAIGQVPATRWSSPSGHGGFVRGAGLFDVAIFGTPPSEASAMDPQQRLLLELGYAAMHGASLRRAVLHGRDLGIFVGMMNADYALLSAGETTPPLPPRYVIQRAVSAPCKRFLRGAARRFTF